ncbi:MAG TPA: UDP-N-acetylmuramoyl-L-alanine--D-glutamate ligase, partial [Baekduia sp.]|nr:UDP-N-acetylmuramoyl-L-alanine--D-glutamate ligase [Baekduia sp.]
RFAPRVAVLLNIEPDHLDRHGTLEDYRDAKLRIFANQGPDDVAIAPPALLPAGLRARAVALDEAVLDGLVGPGELRLRGAHNRQNAAAAALAALERGLPREAVAEGLRTFPGVPHRLEEVARRADVVYVNDSKATNVASTLVALASFDDPSRVHLILGGQGKGQRFDALRDPAGRCAGVYLIGQDAAVIGAALGGGRACGDLAAAVAAARAAAQPGEVVLLSPACASFDQFADFEARGEEFRRLVAN